jgi:hypothetical protein
MPAGVRAPGSALTAQRPGRSASTASAGGALIREGWQVARDGGQTAWITDAGAIAVSGQPLYRGQTTQAGPPWPSGNFAAVKDMGSCSPPLMAEVARTLGERYEPA